jgi:hypothetical protein
MGVRMDADSGLSVAEAASVGTILMNGLATD